jgi:DNA-binding response OmpR family regulator
MLDPESRNVEVGGSSIALTVTETGILELLLRRSPSVVTRRSIAVQVWDEEADAVGSNTIDVHVGRLRTKLGASDVRIETMRGIGYRLVEP